MAVGHGDRSVFEDSSFSGWFNKEYAFYHVDEDAFDKLETELHNLNITIVLGTWCGDSKREVPRFLKILDKLDFPEDVVKLIFVDREKQGLEDEVEDLDIELVPTIIFFRDDEELGRIVESPYETLEEDMIGILE
jgi:thiol-disulfide isomerase/thioredoxin